MVAEKLGESEHRISIVVPVYRGEATLDALVEELAPLTEGWSSPDGRRMRVTEILLVNDGAVDRSDIVIRRLAAANAFVRPVWLSRNFGQHAATIAGMSSSGSEWIVTMDEDGQFDPADIGRMLDAAMAEGAQLVYGSATNAPPHGLARNVASGAAKVIATRVLADGNLVRFSSFRLMLGEVGRGVAAYVGPGVYLDVALSWAFGSVTFCPVKFRAGFVRPSGYSLRKLLSHFWQLVITVGPRPLRLVSLSGVLAAIAGIGVAIAVLVEKIAGNINVPGWTSLAVIVLVIGGLNLLALGVVAEYVGAAVRMAMGKPLYLVTSDPANGPLQRGALQPSRSSEIE
ncbi:MAG: putative mannosyltransferase [Acidimicrobiaceae bacterium]|nr:putative mannosyltransferase [Acidimicrobiaceae bacterium]